MITSKTCLDIDTVLDFIETANENECRLITSAASNHILIPNWFDSDDLGLTERQMKRFLRDTSDTFADNISEQVYTTVHRWKEQHKR